jgi:hypothetical protein
MVPFLVVLLISLPIWWKRIVFPVDSWSLRDIVVDYYKNIDQTTRCVQWSQPHTDAPNTRQQGSFGFSTSTMSSTQYSSWCHDVPLFPSPVGDGVLQRPGSLVSQTGSLTTSCPDYVHSAKATLNEIGTSLNQKCIGNMIVWM